MTVQFGTSIQVKLELPVASITLCRPPLNVIDLAMARELRLALADIESRPDVSVILFKGATGEAFSAGVDIGAHLPETIREMLGSFHDVIRAIIASRKVTIASVGGKCLGGGAEIAIVCDMVYTSRDATWGFPEIKLGCYPPVAAAALAAVVGHKRASELILTGRHFSGDEAVALGLANRSARSDELSMLVGDVLDQIRDLSPAALAHAKKAIYAWDANHFDKGLTRAEKIYLEELSTTHDAGEGIMAFLEKRLPRWTGN